MNDDFSPFGDAFQFFRRPKPQVPCPRCKRPMDQIPELHGSTFTTKVCISCLMSEMMDQAADVSGSEYASGTASTGSTSGPSFEEVLRASARKRQEQTDRERFTREKFDRAREALKRPDPINIMDAEMLRRLIYLCHPDKHGNSTASQIATKYLLDLKAKGKQ